MFCKFDRNCTLQRSTHIECLPSVWFRPLAACIFQWPRWRTWRAAACCWWACYGHEWPDNPVSASLPYRSLSLCLSLSPTLSPQRKNLPRGLETPCQITELMLCLTFCFVSINCWSFCWLIMLRGVVTKRSLILEITYDQLIQAMLSCDILALLLLERVVGEDFWLRIWRQQRATLSFLQFGIVKTGRVECSVCVVFANVIKCNLL